ncbi:MAG: L-threonylcarbamoyladenylate synthase [Verrucomicrobiales bacterium]
MNTTIAATDQEQELSRAVGQAVDLLVGGGVVALPTETVYGLAGDARNPEAVARIFELKERPYFDPLIVHVTDRDQLEEIAEIPAEIEGVVVELIEAFWPGPLSLILPKCAVIPDLVTSGKPTVAVRSSAHPVLRRVLSAFGGPLAAPSANRFGRISPTSASAVASELGGRIPLIVDGGACRCGLESTILAVEPGSRKPLLRVLRRGPVTAEELKVFGEVHQGTADPGHQPLAPGQLESHYAPGTPLRLLSEPGDFAPVEGRRYGLLSYRGRNKDGYLDLVEWDRVAVLSPGSGKLPEAAVRFFFLLRQLDEAGLDEIVAEPVPERGLGSAIMERLRRAASKTSE